MFLPFSSHLSFTLFRSCWRVDMEMFKIQIGGIFRVECLPQIIPIKMFRKVE